MIRFIRLPPRNSLQTARIESTSNKKKNRIPLNKSLKFPKCQLHSPSFWGKKLAPCNSHFHGWGKSPTNLFAVGHGQKEKPQVLHRVLSERRSWEFTPVGTAWVPTQANLWRLTAATKKSSEVDGLTSKFGAFLIRSYIICKTYTQKWIGYWIIYHILYQTLYYMYHTTCSYCILSRHVTTWYPSITCHRNWESYNILSYNIQIWHYQLVPTPEMEQHNDTKKVHCINTRAEL